MSPVEHRLTTYSMSRTSPQDWGAPRSRRSQHVHDTVERERRSKCERDHLTLVPPERAELSTPYSVPLDELLTEMLSEEFLQRLIGIVDGREMDFFANDPLIARVKIALSAPDARPILESKLDELFTSHERGKCFEYTEIVMGLLYAAKMSAVPEYNDILSLFANATSAEFSALRRFSRLLQR